MKVPLSEIMDFMERLAPLDTALEWDNCGLSVGSPGHGVSSILLSLDVRPEVIAEAKDMGANLIITHHPLIFRALKSINVSTPVGKMIRDMVTGDIAHYAAHTNLDRSPNGTGKALAEFIGLSRIAPFSSDPKDEMNMVITGSYGKGKKWDEVLEIIKSGVSIPEIHLVGEPGWITSVAVIPGSGGSLITKLKRPFDLVVTGEVSYHDALYAAQIGQPVAAIGHFSCEKPVMFYLAGLLRERYPRIPVEVATREGEPYRTV